MRHVRASVGTKPDYLVYGALNWLLYGATLEFWLTLAEFHPEW